MRNIRPEAPGAIEWAARAVNHRIREMHNIEWPHEAP